MMKEINKYLSTIGLERIIKISPNNAKIDVAISDIESYMGYKLDSNIKRLLKKYQGMSFVTDVGYIISEHIPILGSSNFLEFGVFLTLEDSHYQILNILINNEDLFEKNYLPIAESTPGDYIAINLNDKSIYFISHDFDEILEKSRYKISESIEQYFLGLKIQDNEDKVSENEKSPKIINVSYSENLLKLAEKIKKDNK